MPRRALLSFLAATSAFWFGAVSFTNASRAAEPAPLTVVSDYDGGEVYWVRDGKKQPVHGLREAWVFNRAMRWLGEADGTGGPILCYSGESPVLLTGVKQVSRWFTGPANDLADVGDDFTRFAKRDAKADLDHVSLPPFQFQVEQNPTAELDVKEATHPWQFVVVVKGRSGPPLFVSPWQEGPRKLTVELRKLYREKGYDSHYAELHFALFIRTKESKDTATVVFRLGLPCRLAVIPSLPVICTAERAKAEGVPIAALVLDEAARPLGASAAAVTATVGGQTVKLGEAKGGVWRETVKGLPVGEHKVTLTAIRREGRRESVRSDLLVRITDGEFLGYDPGLKLLTRAGKPIGPITGSYRGAPMFKGIGTPEESLVQGETQWDVVKGDTHEGQYFNHGGPGYGFHFWESLTGKELDADYAYLAKCGWTVVHLCQGWWYWERLDAGGRIAPHGAEQLALEAAAAARHGLKLHLALSHYPLGKQSKPWAQYLDAGYQRGDYGRPDSKFYEMFKGYLGDFAALFRDETALSSYTAAGEGDVDCGKTFVNEVAAFMQAHDPKHLFLCEPHLNPKPYPGDMNYYVRDGWKPLLGGMRTYMIDRMPPEHIAVQFKLAATGHVFLGEGVFWGFMNGPREPRKYRERIRQEFYTGLAYRSPIQLSWEERVVEDERIVFEAIRCTVDWSKPFQRPRLVLRVGSDLGVLARYEKTLAKMPLEYALILKDDPVPPGALYVLDTQAPFVEPAFESAGGKIPDALKADMPLDLPAGFAASYSWSEDRRTLLAYIHDTGEVERAAGQDLSLGLRNFPAGKLPVRLYGLEAKKRIAEGEFEKEHTLKMPAGTRDLFLIVGR
jgi:hypothetical protein